MSDSKDLSMVLPVYNEVESLKPLVNKLVDFLDGRYDYEIIIVDDGSTDSSTDVVRDLEADYSNVESIIFRENIGKSESLEHGFEKCRGDYVFFMDSDLQYSPQDIPRYVEKLEEGYDAVSGWRVNRKDPKGGKLLPSLFYNITVRFLLGPDLHDHNCGFKAFRREVVKDLELKHGYHRYMLSILHRKGYKITNVKIKHFPRKYGESKYNSPFRLFKGIRDMVRVLFDISRIKLNGS